VIYDLLFRVSAETMLTIAADPKHLGASIGITSVLHTWGSAGVRAIERHLAGGVCRAELVDHQPAEQLREHAHRQEEIGSLGRQSPTAG
jgi:hypothetical protein